MCTARRACLTTTDWHMLCTEPAHSNLHLARITAMHQRHATMAMHTQHEAHGSQTGALVLPLLHVQLAHRALALECKTVATEQQQQQRAQMTHTESGAVRLAGSAAAEQQQLQVALTVAAALMRCLVLAARLLPASALLGSRAPQQQQQQPLEHMQLAAALSGWV